MARDVRVAILGDSRDFQRAVRGAQSETGRLEGAFDRVGRGASRMGLAIAAGAAAGIYGLTRMTIGFIQAAEESQQVSRQTEAVLASMGATSWTTADAVADLSEKLSLQSGIDDELIQSGQNVLLTFGQVQNRIGRGRNIFDRATAAALDMSVALGTDMNSAAIQVGKALNDPIRGLTQLRRVGIQFTAQQESQIRAMQEAGDVAGAQALMLDELERQFGGSAEAQATASGKLATAWGNLQEQLGEYLLPVFASVAEWLASKLPIAADKLKGPLEALRGFFEGVRTSVETFVTAFMTGSDDVANSGFQGVMAELGETSRGVFEWLRDNVPPVIDTINDKLQGFIDNWDGYVADFRFGWENFVIGAIIVRQEWDNFYANFIAGANRVKGWVLPVWNAIYRLFTESIIPAAKLLAGIVWNNLTLSWEVMSRVASVGLGIIQWQIGLVTGAVRLLIGALEKAWDILGRVKDAAGGFGGGGIGIPGSGIGLLTQFLPKFDSGGVVPGRIGSPQLALVHGGETILPTHKGGVSLAGGGGSVTVNVTVNALDPDAAQRAVVEAISKYARNNRLSFAS